MYIPGPKGTADGYGPLQVVRIVPCGQIWLITNKSGRRAESKKVKLPPTTSTYLKCRTLFEILP